MGILCLTCGRYLVDSEEAEKHSSSCPGRNYALPNPPAYNTKACSCPVCGRIGYWPGEGGHICLTENQQYISKVRHHKVRKWSGLGCVLLALIALGLSVGIILALNSLGGR